MSLTAIVRALVDAGATPQMIAAAVEAAETERLADEKLRLETERAHRRPTDAKWYCLRALVFSEKGRVCSYCGGIATEVDHVIPRSLGGPDTFANLVPTCKPCNSSKRHSDVDVWRSMR